MAISGWLKFHNECGLQKVRDLLLVINCSTIFSAVVVSLSRAQTPSTAHYVSLRIYLSDQYSRDQCSLATHFAPVMFHILFPFVCSLAVA